MENVEKSINTPIIERKEIKNTPFVCIKADNDYFLTIGNFRLTREPFQSYAECEEYLDSHKWEVISILATITAQQTVLTLKNEENEKN